MTAYAPQLVAHVLRFTNGIPDAGKRVLQTLLQMLQPLLYTHGRNRTVQRRHAGVLEAVYRILGALHDLLPEGHQPFPCLPHLCLQCFQQFGQRRFGAGLLFRYLCEFGFHVL